MVAQIDQSRVFEDGEGDLWFKRNVAHLNADRGSDVVLDTVAELARAKPQSVRSLCEVGCANGWRLAALAHRLPLPHRSVGFDASSSAIADGQARWPDLHLYVASADHPRRDERFDLVIVSFVLHWIDRRRLAQSIAAIDGLVKEDGYLIVADFLPDGPCTRHYHHRSDVELFTYKQDYASCFLSLGIYEEAKRTIFAHGPQLGSVEEIPEQDRAACSLLHKTLRGYRKL